LGKNPKELRGNKEHSNSAPETLLILRLRKLFRLLPIRAVVLGLCLITDWNGVATFEPAMKVNVGAALRAKRADYERGRLSTHRTRTNRLFGFMFTGAIFKRSGGHGFSHLVPYASKIYNTRGNDAIATGLKRPTAMNASLILLAFGIPSLPLAGSMESSSSITG
jgi:hypothetical protein